MQLAKQPLITALGAYNLNMPRWNVYKLSNFNKHNNKQLLGES